MIGRVGQAEVGAQFSEEGATLTAAVVGVFGAKDTGLGTTTRTLLKSIADFAKQGGLSEVKLQAVAVINKDLEQRLIERGFEKATVVVDGESTTAYSKTFEVG